MAGDGDDETKGREKGTIGSYPSTKKRKRASEREVGTGTRCRLTTGSLRLYTYESLFCMPSSPPSTLACSFCFARFPSPPPPLLLLFFSPPPSASSLLLSIHIIYSYTHPRASKCERCTVAPMVFA